MTCLSTHISGSPKPLSIDLPSRLRFSRSWVRSTLQSARLAIGRHKDMVSSGGNHSLGSPHSCMRGPCQRINVPPLSPSMGHSMDLLRTQPSSTPTMLGPLTLAGINWPLQILFHWATAGSPGHTHAFGPTLSDIVIDVAYIRLSQRAHSAY
jgi:hypothetical protein